MNERAPSAEPEPAAAAAPGLRLLRPVVLVGLMGAGKTSVGKRLAALLAAPFADSDAEVETAARMSVPEVFARYGEPAFRDVERRVVARLVGAGPRIVATGGGAFVEPATRAAIAGRAVSVWLDADLETLWDRVRDRPGRPLLEAPDPRARLAELLARRRPAYALADVRVESRRGATHETMARAIVDAVRAREAADPAAPRTFAETAP